MQRPKRGKCGVALKIARQVQLTDSPNEHGGLVLDDVLATLDATRKAYKLPEAKFRLQDVESQAGARSAVERIITDSLARHGHNIYAKPHPLLDAICDIRRGKRIERPPLYSGWQIKPSYASRTLRALLERGLQTIVQLPRKVASLKDGKRELELLALHCDKLAQEIENALRVKVFRERASAYFRETQRTGLDQFARQAEELRRTAGAVRTILAKTRLVRQKTDSPNPQVQVALYLIGWFDASTGKKGYVPFKTLLNAAYATNKMQVPAWAERLEVEMTRHRARRRAWARSISVPSNPLTPSKTLQKTV